MSTSQPISDGTSREAANLHIKELERELFIARGMAQAVAEEERKIKQDIVTKMQKTRQDLETENDKSRGESIDRQLTTSYHMQQATRELIKLKEELATLGALLAAEEEEHSMEDDRSENPLETSDSPLGNAALRAENTRLKKKVDVLSRTEKIMQEHVLEVQGLAEKYERRIDNDINRLETYKEYTNTLEKDVAFYRETFQELHMERQSAEEAKSAVYADVKELMADAVSAEKDYKKSLDRGMKTLHAAVSQFQSCASSIQKVVDLGRQGEGEARAKSDLVWTEWQSQLGRTCHQSDAKYVEALERPMTINPFKSNIKAGVAPVPWVANGMVQGPTQQHHTPISSFFGYQTAKPGSWLNKGQPVHPAHTAASWGNDVPPRTSTHLPPPRPSTAATATSAPGKESKSSTESRHTQASSKKNKAKEAGTSTAAASKFEHAHDLQAKASADLGSEPTVGQTQTIGWRPVYRDATGPFWDQPEDEPRGIAGGEAATDSPVDPEAEK